MIQNVNRTYYDNKKRKMPQKVGNSANHTGRNNKIQMHPSNDGQESGQKQVQSSSTENGNKSPRDNTESNINRPQPSSWRFWSRNCNIQQPNVKKTKLTEIPQSDSPTPLVNESFTISSANNKKTSNIDDKPIPLVEAINHNIQEEPPKDEEQTINLQKKKGWSFWNRQPVSQEDPSSEENKSTPPKHKGDTDDVSSLPINDDITMNEPLANLPQLESINKTDKIIPNTYIRFNPDAVLFKNSSSTTPPNNNQITIESQDVPDIELEQPPNIVVPSFDILPKKTIWRTLQQIFSGGSYSQKHLYKIDPNEKFLEMSNGETRPIKVLLIGVHGFFPMKMLRNFIGEPTGTSNRFISEAEKVVLDYFKQKNVEVEISKIALEKEGEIFERVDFFYEVMKRWSKELHESDFIYFVTHSQGCPVTIILLAKLMETGIINTDSSSLFNDIETDLNFTSRKQIISILGMAGINNGPFYGRDQTLLVKAYSTIAKDAMMELFEFQKCDSLQSKKLIQGIRTIISNNVKLTFVASINDQLVPLYSSFCQFAQHPNIFRATFIDRGSNTPDFITGIVKIAGTLLNLGYFEHNIIKEISPSLVGTLTGGGHSTIYNEYQVYLLGLKFALETSDTYGEIPVTYVPYKANDLKANPYRLPWAMRGLLHETRKRLNSAEIFALYKEYEEWKPETPVLKDIKYRLNGLKYQL